MIRATIIACLALASSAIPLQQGTYLGTQDVPNPGATVIRAVIKPGNLMDFHWVFNMFSIRNTFDCRDVPFMEHNDRIEVDPTSTPCVAQIPAFFARYFTISGNLVMRKTDANTLHLVTGLMDCVNVFLRFTGTSAAPTAPVTTTSTTRRVVPVTTVATTRSPRLAAVPSSTSSSTTVSTSSSSTSTSGSATTSVAPTTVSTTAITTTVTTSATTTTSIAPVNSTTTTVAPTNATTAITTGSPSPRIDNSTTTTSGKSATTSNTVISYLAVFSAVLAVLTL